jgi:hypothetical protein
MTTQPSNPRVDQTDLQWSAADERRWQRRMKIGKLLNRFLDPVMEMDAVKAQEDLELARSPQPRLNPSEIRHITEYLTQVQDREIRRDYFARTPLERTFPGLLVPLVEEVLERDLLARSVMDIGAYYFHVDHHLATKHPNIQFIGVDFPANLAEYNSEFARPNLRAVSGYAMDLIERGDLRADVVVFSATGAEIKSNELLRYLQLFRSFARWVVFSEPLYNLPGGGVVDPLTLQPEKCLAIYAQPDYLPHKKGPLARAHNYRAMLEATGYTVRHYHAFKPEFTDIRWVQAVAENPAVTGASTQAPRSAAPAAAGAPS